MSPGILLLGERMWVLAHTVPPCYCFAFQSPPQSLHPVPSDEHSVRKHSWRLEVWHYSNRPHFYWRHWLWVGTECEGRLYVSIVGQLVRQAVHMPAAFLFFLFSYGLDENRECVLFIFLSLHLAQYLMHRMDTKKSLLNYTNLYISFFYKSEGDLVVSTVFRSLKLLYVVAFFF